MKIGLIARAETHRGLGVQSKNFYDHMPVDRVLRIDMPRPDGPVDKGWYPGAWPIDYDDQNHALNENLVRQWLDGLDVVFTVETPYDWRLPRWAREMGVKTVIQGNPEFYRHNQERYRWQEHPTQWWWPTSWRLNELPAGPVIPVPMPDNTPRVERAQRGEVLRILHVQGKKAFMDRNGSEVLASALRVCRERVHVTMYGLLGDLPFIENRDNVTYERFPEGIEDRWVMYQDQHLLIIPRRYGGLCLPALEAAACGVAVAMPDFPPNEELSQLAFDARNRLQFDLACGPVVTADTNHMDLGGFIDDMARTPGAVAMAQDAAYRTVPRWSQWRQRYLDAFEALP